jgi:hypothetical protein
MLDSARAVDRFVAAGGRILTTGSSGFAEDGASQLSSSGAERRLAVTTKADLLWSTYVAPEAGVVADHTYAGPIAPIYGAYHYCEWRNGAEHRLKMLARAPFGPPEKAYGHQPVDHPGYVMWRSGKGRSATVPWTIGRGYRDLGLTVERDLVLSLVEELLDGDETISAELPEQVEMTVHKNGDRTVVHLVNMSGARPNGFGKPLPIRDGILRIRGIGDRVSATALVSETSCAVSEFGDGIAVALPEINRFEVIVIGDSSATD